MKREYLSSAPMFALIFGIVLAACGAGTTEDTSQVQSEAAAAACGKPGLHVERNRIQASDTVNVRGEFFAIPNECADTGEGDDDIDYYIPEEVDLVLVADGEEWVVGHGYPDSDGEFFTEIVLPEGLNPGAWQLEPRVDNEIIGDRAHFELVEG